MSKNALLVVDMVKDFTDPEGLTFYPQNRVILPFVKRVIDYFHATGQLVVFLRHSYRAGKFDRNLETMRPTCIEGTGGDEIDPMLPVFDQDYQVFKRRYSGFFGTDLDLILRENAVDRVIIVGTKTNCCIRATATDSYNLNYETVVLADCVATDSAEVNNVHLKDIDKYIGIVMDSEAFIREDSAASNHVDSGRIGQTGSGESLRDNSLPANPDDSALDTPTVC